MIAEVFADVVQATVAGCHQVYGRRLQAVVVFGSVARDRIRPDSDIDLLVVAEPLPQGRLARMDEFDSVEDEVAPALAEARSQGVETYLSPLVRTSAELDQGGFVMFDIACDGRACFDRHGEIARYLQQVREKLDRRGATRWTPGGDRYWMLEPNVRPGQVVVL